MAKGRIGLDIGSTAVRAVELAGGEPPTVVRAAQVPLPRRRRRERRGPRARGRDPGAPRSCGSAAGSRAVSVWMGVGNQRVVVREIALPYLPEKELTASLGFQVQEFIPMPVDEAVLDYDPLGEFEQDGPPDAPDAPGRGPARHGRSARECGDRRQARAVGLDLVPFALVRAVGHIGRRHGPRRDRRGGDDRHRRARDEHRRARAGASRGSCGSCRPAAATSRSRSRGGSRSRTRSPSS